MISTKEETRRKLNADFDETPSVHHRYNYKLAKQYLRNKKVLDVGCWTGQFFKLAIKSTDKLYGVDPGKEAINFAKSKFPEANLKVGKAQNLPFRNNWFDVVTYLEVIEHIPQEHETKSLDEIHRVLKNDGTLVVSTPSNHWLSILLDPAYFLIGHRHYGEKELRRLLETSGFEIVNIYTTGGFFRLASLITDSIVKHVFRTKLNHPRWLVDKIKEEYDNGGFAQLHVIAQKV